jgi:serine/threonine-protein kinase HipA
LNPRNSLAIQLLSTQGEWLTVGFLRHSNEISWFETLPEYWETPHRPVLGQIFEDRGASWRPSQRVTLPNWFSHLLPEGSIRAAVAESLHVNAAREFFLLSRIGLDDLPGAVRVVPGENVAELHAPEEFGHEGEEVSQDEAILKFSLAGIQPKFSVYEKDQRGLTIPARGQAGNWIVKLPDGRPGFDAVPEAEFGSLELARAIGISVPDTKLIPVQDIEGLPTWAYRNPGNAFAIQRFDRSANNGRIHAEVLAQIRDIPTTNERYKYSRANFETISSLISGICGKEALGEVLDRIVLNVLLGNGDAHLKNWAVVYPDSRIPQLSPLFDVLPTVLYIPDDDLGPNLNGSKNFFLVNLESFDKIARRSGWETSAARTRVSDSVHRIANNWSILKEFMTHEQYLTLTKRRDSLPLLRSAN